MKAPVSVSYSGDKSAARALRKIALAEMKRTEDLMEFQGLKQLLRVVDFAPGVVFTTSKCFGIFHVKIHVEKEVVVPEKYQEGCLCNCNFAFGIVKEKQEDPLEGDGNPPLYTALVCRAKTGYVVMKNLLATDFSPYLPGQKVLLIPYLYAEYKCCENIYVATGCKPWESKDDLAEDFWRSSMRIIPWRAFPLKKWIVMKQSDIINQPGMVLPKGYGING